jgi:hypothetical protein
MELGPVELVVVPRGIEHRTAAGEEAEVIPFRREQRFGCSARSGDPLAIC